MPTFTDPLREIDAASVKEYALQRGAAELSDDFVGNRCTLERNLDKILLSILDTLTDSVRNFA